MSETGHAKNVANFETVTIILAGLGGIYNPSQTLILLAALQTKLAEAKAALDALDAWQAAKKVAVNERQAEFEDVEKLAVNIKREAEVTVNDAAFTKDLQTIVRKFGGKAAPGTPKPTDDPATPDADESNTGKSVSERSYDKLVSHFADLIALLKTQPAYNPNDSEMRVGTLEAKLAAMQDKNNAVKTANAALGNGQDARDAILYDKDTGVLKLVKLIKTQLARKPGRDSAAYQQVNALEFRKY